MTHQHIAAAAVALAVSIAACAPRAATRAPSAADARPGHPTLTLEFSSELPADYRVLSGPIETYQPLTVNARARAALEAVARGWRGEGPPATLRVRLLAFDPRYRQRGSMAESGHLPEEIRTSGTLRLTAAVEREGRVLAERELRAEGTSVWRWDDASPVRDPYAFEQALDEAVARAAREVGAFVSETLAAAR